MTQARDRSTGEPEPAGEADGVPDRYELQERYLELTRELLPAAAVAAAGRGERWPIKFDHCFMRIVLDHLFGGCWYDHLDRKLRAYKQLHDDQLVEAVRLGETMLDGGEPVVAEMNRRSLAWRGKG